MKRPVFLLPTLAVFLAPYPLAGCQRVVEVAPSLTSIDSPALFANASAVHGPSPVTEVSQPASETIVIEVIEVLLSSAAAASPSPAAPSPAAAAVEPSTSSRTVPTASLSAPAHQSTPAPGPTAAAAQQAISALVLDDTVQRDPASMSFLGQIPDATVDLPLTVVFLVLFAAAAVTHISIYRANAKRGHKFLLSDVIFDFCMIRTLTCIFRIVWVFVSMRGVVLAALIFENGGAAVLFTVNIFFVQRLVRSIQPRYGWHPSFGYATLALAFSVPAIIILNIVSLSVSFVSVGNELQLDAAEGLLRFGASWNLILVTFPMVALFAACVIPGPKPEPFGRGQFRTKAAVLLFGSATLSVGAALRLAAAANPQPTGSTNVLFSKGLFYTTGFMLEIMVVALYAVSRVDLLFHIPNGAAGPGDYRQGSEERTAAGPEDLRGNLLQAGVPYEVMGADSRDTDRLLVTFSMAAPGPQRVKPPRFSEEVTEKSISPRTPGLDRVSRRQSLIDALRPQRPWRPPISTMYATEDGEEISQEVLILQPQRYVQDGVAI